MWLILKKRNGHAESVVGPVIPIYPTREEAIAAVEIAEAKYPGEEFYLFKLDGTFVPRSGYQFIVAPNSDKITISAPDDSVFGLSLACARNHKKDSP